MDSKSLFYENGYVYPYQFDMDKAKEIDVSNIYDCFVEDQKSLAKELREKDLMDKLNKAIKVTKRR